MRSRLRMLLNGLALACAGCPAKPGQLVHSVPANGAVKMPGMELSADGAMLVDRRMCSYQAVVAYLQVMDQVPGHDFLAFKAVVEGSLAMMAFEVNQSTGYGQRGSMTRALFGEMQRLMRHAIEAQVRASGGTEGAAPAAPSSAVAMLQTPEGKRAVRDEAQRQAETKRGRKRPRHADPGDDPPPGGKGKGRGKGGGKGAGRGAAAPAAAAANPPAAPAAASAPAPA